LSSEDDTYSSIFTALKHPIRRRILRILDQAPTTYTEIQKQLEIDNGLLNYHLENMKDLLCKGEDGRYSLSEFGRAALGVTVKVEEPTRRRREGVSVKLLIGVILVLVIAAASLTGYSVILNNNILSQGEALSKKTVELNAANNRLETLAPMVALFNLSKPATWETPGVQIASGYPMSYTYQNLTRWTSISDDRSSVICFYVPEDGVVVHLELMVDPVNVYELDLSLQRGNAWRNETWVKVGTKGEYFNLTDPSNPTLSDAVWMSPVLWSVKTLGNGAYESPVLSRGWYTFSLFGPVVVYGPNSYSGTYVRAPSFHNSSLMSYRVLSDFSIRRDAKPTFFAVTTDR
jgi:hypothetical protein